MFCSKTKFFVCFAVLAGMAFAAPPKTWDAIYKAEGEGDYTAVKIVGNIRMGKYTNYKEIQPVSFKVEDGMFSFSASGNMVVPANKIEKENFYQQCDKSKEAWVSYFNKPMTFGKEEQIVHIAGVDLACGDDAYALSDLRIKFTNPKAQEYWAANMEKYEKYKREQVAELRRAEQQHHADIRSMSGSFTDPRDGQTYRTIKVEGREWFAQNVNCRAIPGATRTRKTTAPAAESFTTWKAPARHAPKAGTCRETANGWICSLGLPSATRAWTSAESLRKK